MFLLKEARMNALAIKILSWRAIKKHQTQRSLSFLLPKGRISMFFLLETDLSRVTCKHTSSISFLPIYLPFPLFATRGSLKLLPLSCHFFTNVLFFVGRCYIRWNHSKLPFWVALLFFPKPCVRDELSTVFPFVHVFVRIPDGQK